MMSELSKKFREVLPSLGRLVVAILGAWLWVMRSELYELRMDGKALGAAAIEVIPNFAIGAA